MTNKLQASRADAGVSLIEVVVAVLVFALVSAGIVAGIASIQGFSRDGRAREVAVNLAASDLASVRSAVDPTSLGNTTWNTTVGTTTYTVTRTVAWVAGTDTGCSATGTAPTYKRVDVSVTWAGKLAVTPAVTTDTIVSAPARLTDPSTGTVMVSVLGADGTPRSGVAVTMSPTSGGAALASQPPATDANGCSYALQVAPGTYSIAVSKSGYVDASLNASPTTTVTVVAGQTVAAPPFQYDAAITLSPTYATVNGSNVAQRPSNLDLTFVTGSATYARPVGAGMTLYPFPSGYSAIGGALGTVTTGGCPAVDPAQWAQSLTGTLLKAGARNAPVTAAPGGSTSIAVPMGGFSVKISGSAAYLTAVSQDSSGSPAGEPGCPTAMTYTFGSLSGTNYYQLPYGTWNLYTGTTSGATTTPVAASNITIYNSYTTVPTSNQITLDPRTP